MTNNQCAGTVYNIPSGLHPLGGTEESQRSIRVRDLEEHYNSRGWT